MWAPDDSLEQSVWSWLPEPRGSPARYHHSLGHQLVVVLISSWSFQWNSLAHKNQQNRRLQANITSLILLVACNLIIRNEQKFRITFSLLLGGSKDCGDKEGRQAGHWKDLQNYFLFDIHLFVARNWEWQCCLIVSFEYILTVWDMKKSWLIICLIGRWRQFMFSCFHLREHLP